ncbi:unnamed protein product, partial [Iphiclides podalirius]
MERSVATSRGPILPTLRTAPPVIYRHRGRRNDNEINRSAATDRFRFDAPDLLSDKSTSSWLVLDESLLSCDYLRLLILSARTPASGRPPDVFPIGWSASDWHLAPSQAAPEGGAI